MKAKYLVRLDDACHSMHPERWNRVESILDVYGIRPIVAVIPDNQDKTEGFFTSHYDPQFWERVHVWKAKGWTIAMHGYQHRYVTTDAGIVPMHHHSEFAGLDYNSQREKIKASWNIFQNNNIEPNVWVAPCHSFDGVTLRALRDETNIQIVSDGIAVNTFSRQGFHWLPQQLWSFKRFPFGTYTLCLHPSTMSEKEFARFEQSLQANQDLFVGLEEVLFGHRDRNIIDRLFALVWWYVYRKKRGENRRPH